MAAPRALITGANRGLGLELARQYRDDGWEVLATCRLPETAAELRGLAEPGRLAVHPLDVCDRPSIEALERKLNGLPLDLVLNNAGIFGPRRGERGQEFGCLDYDAWKQVLDTNTLGPLRVAEAFAENLAAGNRKLLVAVTSGLGSITNNSGGLYAYRSSKAALNSAMHGLSHDLAGRDVTVVVMHPGWVRTDMGGPGAALSPEESVRAMRRVIAGLQREDSGRFLDYSGQELPW